MRRIDVTFPALTRKYAREFGDTWKIPLPLRIRYGAVAGRRREDCPTEM